MRKQPVSLITSNFHFAPIDEETHRHTRMSGAVIAICVAILPFCLNVVWRVYADNPSKQLGYGILESGFTDLALAGVVIAVSTFTNTYFSVKLLGWQGVSKETFGALLFLTLSSIFSFVAYLESTHEYISPPVRVRAFIATFLIVAAGILWSIVAHYCFLEDEFRCARTEQRRIPHEDISGKWI
jgi:hypothetical protein